MKERSQSIRSLLSKYEVHDAANEDDQESPVALLQTMDLNCDDEQINATVLTSAEIPESGSRGASDTPNDLNN